MKAKLLKSKSYGSIKKTLVRIRKVNETSYSVQEVGTKKRYRVKHDLVVAADPPEKAEVKPKASKVKPKASKAKPKSAVDKTLDAILGEAGQSNDEALVFDDFTVAERKHLSVLKSRGLLTYTTKKGATTVKLTEKGGELI